MIVRLSPTKHENIGDIKNTIIPQSSLRPDFKGSYVSLWLEKNQYAKDARIKGFALRVDCQGCKLGYIPETASVKGWRGEGDGWAQAVEAVRNQVYLDYEREFDNTLRWSGHMANVRYHDGSGYIDYPEYAILPNEVQEKYHIDAVSARFDWVEEK